MASLIVSPTKVRLNRVSYVVNLYGVGTTWTVSLPTFTISALAGCSLGSQAITSDTVASVHLTTGSTPGTLTFTDPSTGASYNVKVTSVQLPPPALFDDGRRRGTRR